MRKIEFKLDKVMFKSKENGFSICRVFPINNVDNLHIGKYGNISIKGMMSELVEDIEYECLITEEEKNQYGTTYSVSGVRPIGMGSIETDEEMLIFIKAMIGNGVYDKLKNVKDISKVIKNKNIKKLTSVKGIGKKIANKIIEIWETEGLNSKYISELITLGFNEDHIDKLNDKYSELSLVVDIVKKNPYKVILDDVNIRIQVIDKIAHNLNISSEDNRRMEAYVYKALKDESVKDYKSYIPIKEFDSNKTITSISNRIGMDRYNEILNKLINENIFIKIDGNIGLYKIYLSEKGLIREINRISKSTNEFDIQDIDNEISIEESNMGFEFTEKQKDAIKTCIKNNFTMIKGHAGTGKTTITNAILNILERSGRKLEIKQCALSGKASQVLSNATGREAYTIHKLLEMKNYQDDENTKKKIYADVLVIDELSMVNIGLLKDLISSIQDGVKVICMGDSNQLPSLAYGKLIDDISMMDNVGVISLTEVHRQALESGIITTANGIRENSFDVKDDYLVIGNMNDMVIKSNCNPEEETINTMVDLYDINNKEGIQIVCATSAACYSINQKIQSKVNNVSGKHITVNAYGNIPNVKYAKYKIFKDDKIMIIKNMYDVETKDSVDNEDSDFIEGFGSGKVIFSCEEDVKYNLYNGNMGTLTEIHDEYVIIDVNGVEYVIDCEDYDNIQLAYACTCHKLQGSASDIIIICMLGGYSEQYLMSNEWLYTAITRSRKLCYLYGDKYDINKGIRTRNINKKTTFMELILAK